MNDRTLYSPKILSLLLYCLNTYSFIVTGPKRLYFVISGPCLEQHAPINTAHKFKIRSDRCTADLSESFTVVFAVHTHIHTANLWAAIFGVQYFALGHLGTWNEEDRDQTAGVLVRRQPLCP